MREIFEIEWKFRQNLTNFIIPLHWRLSNICTNTKTPILPCYLKPCTDWCTHVLPLPQVFPDVLHVRELGLCSSDAPQDTKLEATVQILPLVGATLSLLYIVLQLHNVIQKHSVCMILNRVISHLTPRIHKEWIFHFVIFFILFPKSYSQSGF